MAEKSHRNASRGSLIGQASPIALCCHTVPNGCTGASWACYMAFVFVHECVCCGVAGALGMLCARAGCHATWRAACIACATWHATRAVPVPAGRAAVWQRRDASHRLDHPPRPPHDHTGRHQHLRDVCLPLDCGESCMSHALSCLACAGFRRGCMQEIITSGEAGLPVCGSGSCMHHVVSRHGPCRS
jgi:hypothetical protein